MQHSLKFVIFYLTHITSECWMCKCFLSPKINCYINYSADGITPPHVVFDMQQVPVIFLEIRKCYKSVQLFSLPFHYVGW